MPWISLLVLVPLLGALSMFAVPEGNGTQARIHALVTALGAVALVVVVIAKFDRGVGGPQMVDRQSWASEVGLSWTMWVDGISLWLLALTAGIFFLAIVASCWGPCDRPRAYLGLLLLAEAGLLGLFSAGDLVLFYVFWEAMLVPFYFLIGMWGGRDRRQATLQFVIYTMVGSLIMLVAILATAYIARDVTGQFTFDIEQLRGVAFTTNQSTLLFGAFSLAFAIKLPLWPFHSWLPRAYSAAPIVVTALLAAVMSKAGVYGLLRIGLPLFPAGADYFAVPLIVLALVGIVYGSLVAWRAPTMRLLVGYSSLAHLGFVVLGIMAFDPQAAQGAVLQMVNHGVVVAAAFGIVGIISMRSGTEDVDGVAGLAAGAPRLAAVFLIVAMASLAMPGTNSFVGEFFILTGTFRHHAWAAAIATVGIVYAAVYMLRLYQKSMNGPRAGTDGRRVELNRLDYVMMLPLVTVMGLIALWPAGLVGATTATLTRTIAPAQVAAERPAAQILATVVANPPASALPLPGDPAPTTQGPTP